MNRIILLIGLCWMTKASAQFTNGGFDLWDTISMFGQPYIDPVGWMTNNGNDFIGLANTPVTRGIDSTGYFARIESNDRGIDALLPGKMMQKISAKNLAQITYAYQCAYIFQTGMCMVKIFGADPDTLLYSENYTVEDVQFQVASIDILPAWTLVRDSIKIQFIAKGNLDYWDEEEDGHSVFHIDNVSASYITSTNHLQVTPGINVYPNPSNGEININLENVSSPCMLEILTLTGQVIFAEAITGSLHVQNIPAGFYIVKVTSATESIAEPIMVYR